MQAGPQHCVLLAGVADTDDVLHVCQDAFDQFVGQDGGGISEPKQGVVGEHNLHMSVSVSVCVGCVECV